ncbi:rhamnosyltransferase [Dysgonomonas alginatilytica]|uniref:Rhamnosyltransferase n=1 Tax=Dysgonomonas alginatilytica TaxID=1605892 RepID=A0A2V3PKX4_9BACT|nr:glycosyltransferase family 2 protein [Dysgonomonas alginatilytica]PXV62184.1 rhamnosyltransferase [Dysgonomonas alginatilytica]
MIFAIIVTYNSELNLLIDQFNSIIDQVGGIVYVENGSENQSVITECLAQYSNSFNVHILSNKENMGLGYAQNQGIKEAFKNEADHILLLDHDSVVEPRFVYNLLEVEQVLLKENIRVGAVAPTAYNPDNNKLFPVSVWILNGLWVKKIVPCQNQHVFASFIMASGTLVRKEVLDDVGLMDEGLFVDIIDLEWGCRIKSKNYQLVVTPLAKMMHKIGDSRISFLGRNMSNHSPIRRYYLSRNCLLSFRYKHIPVGFSIGGFGRTILRFLVVLLKSTERKKYWTYCLLGFRDGLLGRYGKCTISLK